MHDIDINTRVELANETINTTATPGQAGKVAIIGSFPNFDDGVYSFTTLRKLRNHYGIVAGTESEYNFDGARSARRIFMEGINGYKGATEVVTVNIRDSDDAESNGSTLPTSLTVNTITEDEADSGDCDYDIRTLSDTNGGGTLTMDKLIKALTKLSGENIDILFIASDLNGAVVKGSVEMSDLIAKILDFLDTEFTVQRPTNLILPIRCADEIDTGQDTAGIVSEIINVDDAIEIANQFAENENCLNAIGLYYQGGTLMGEDVDYIEVAAHMCGFTASINVSQSLTYQTIPGLTAIDEEAFFGEHDAGYILNSAGVMVLTPKSRKDNTFCVKNDTQGNGWNANHIRSVSYLLKQYNLVNGLGINNYQANREAFKAQLTATNNQVLSSVDVIQEVTIGDIEVRSPYRIYVPVEISLVGVISIITMGVNMTLIDESAEV
ncbi:MAG: hypothetical protein LUC37_06600 [Prevotella sp.]|nr:hypothetical protein [Prevotella sp.]